MGNWKVRGNHYIQLVKVLNCKLPTNGKQLPAFPYKIRQGFELLSPKWEASVLPLHHHRKPPVVPQSWSFTVYQWERFGQSFALDAPPVWIELPDDIIKSPPSLPRLERNACITGLFHCGDRPSWGGFWGIGKTIEKIWGSSCMLAQDPSTLKLLCKTVHEYIFTLANK